MKYSGEHEQEGVIKFHLDFTCEPIEYPVFPEKLQQLNAARSVLKAHALIGQDPGRYGGDGFGNISIRFESRQFLISGTQTGHLDLLTYADIALVEDFHCPTNRLVASGLSKPSSESMTHGVAYQTLEAIMAVIHVHSPDIWRHADTLGLAATAADVAYGTPAMAEAVRRLLLDECHKTGTSSQLNNQALVFVMKGHEDGVVAVGSTLALCTQALLDCLSLVQAR